MLQLALLPPTLYVSPSLLLLLLLSFTFVCFRVAFWVHGVSPLMKDQNSGKQQSWILLCKCIGFSYSLLLNINPFWVCSSILVVLGSFVNMAYLSWRNKVKKRPEERAKLLEKYIVADKQDGGNDDDGGLDAWLELGDRHPDFVYTLWVFLFF